MPRIRGAGRRGQLEKYLLGLTDWDTFRSESKDLADGLAKGREAATVALNTLRFRLKLGLTVPEVVARTKSSARRTGVSKATLHRIETGQRGTQLDTLIDLSQVYHVRVKDLFEPHDIKNLPPDFVVSLSPADHVPRLAKAKRAKAAKEAP